MCLWLELSLVDSDFLLWLARSNPCAQKIQPVIRMNYTEYPWDGMGRDILGTGYPES